MKANTTDGGSRKECRLTDGQKEAIIELVGEIRYERGRFDFDIELEEGLNVLLRGEIERRTRLVYHDTQGLCPDEYDTERCGYLEIEVVLTGEDGSEERLPVEEKFGKECNEYLTAC